MRSSPLLAILIFIVAVPLAAAANQTKEGPVYQPGNGVSAPVVVKEVKPQYTAEARKARIQGIVVLDCVVETDGSVGAVKVARGLDPGLDQEAVKAARLWTFEPGTKEGKPVRVEITLEMTFTLK